MQYRPYYCLVVIKKFVWRFSRSTSIKIAEQINVFEFVIAIGLWSDD